VTSDSQNGIRKVLKLTSGVNAPARPRRCKEMFAELSSYLDDELDDSLCEELEKHMDGCAPCQAFLQSLEDSIEQCKARPADLPDPRVAARLRRELMVKYQDLMTNRNKQEATTST
jgi:hypothetical protein